MDAETLTEPERRVALLDWLARGRDVRIAAELCGEKHDWAKDIAKAAGHPDRDQIRQALAAAKAELHPPRQLLKPDSIAPPRPVRAALVEHVARYADGVALRRCKVCLGPIDDDGTDRTQCHRCRTVLAIASGAPAPAPEVVNEAGGTCTRRPGCPWTGGGECGDCLGDSRDDDGNLRDGAGELVEDEDGAPLPAEHVHEPRVVLEGRVWHAVCDACGTTWHRTLCTAPGCGAYVTGVLVEVAGRFARLVSRTGVEDYQDGTGSRRPIPGDGAHRPGKLVRDEVHARNNARKATGNAKWSGLLIEGAVEAHAADDPADLRHALLDTAATAVAWIHALDHRGAPDDDTPVAVVSSEPRSQLLELLDEVTVAHTAHMLARLDVGKARRAGLNEALEEALAKAEQASYAVTAAELRARAAIVRHLPPGATA